MHEPSVLIAILVVLAISTCAQAVALLTGVRVLRRLERRLDLAEQELVALRPRLDRLGSIIDDVSHLTEGAATHLPRLVTALEGGIEQVRGLASLGAFFLLKPLRPLGTAFALWKGLGSAARAYRQLRPASISPSRTPLS
jgi:hypothetical protein